MAETKCIMELLLCAELCIYAGALVLQFSQSCISLEVSSYVRVRHLQVDSLGRRESVL